MKARNAMIVASLGLGAGFLFHAISSPLQPTKIDVVTLENQSREPLTDEALSIPEADLMPEHDREVIEQAAHPDSYPLNKNVHARDKSILSVPNQLEPVD